MQCGTHTRNFVIEREVNMQDHLKMLDGERKVLNINTGKVMEADIQMPSFNEMDSQKAYPPDGVRPSKPEEKDQHVKNVREPLFLARLEEAYWPFINRCQIQEFDKIHPAFPRFRFGDERLWP
jgi:hypothetical protein